MNSFNQSLNLLFYFISKIDPHWNRIWGVDTDTICFTLENAFHAVVSHTFD